MNLHLVLNPIEPAPLSIKHSQGLGLDLSLLLKNPDGSPVDPDTVNPVLHLRARSDAKVLTFKLETYDSTNGITSTHIDGGWLQDPHGYQLEVFSTVPAEDPEGAPVPQRMIASGRLALKMSAYAQGMGAMVV